MTKTDKRPRMKNGVVKRGSGYAFKIELPKAADGRRRPKWIHGFRTEKEALAAKARAQVDIQHGIDLEPGKITVADLLRRWLQSSERSVEHRTIQRYRSIVEHHLNPTLGGIPLSKLRPLHIESAIASWSAGDRKDRKVGKLSSRSVAHNLNTLKTALRQAVRWDLLKRNPVDAVKPLKIQSPEMKTVDGAGIAALIAAAQGTELEVPIILALGSGLRRGEVLGLRWSDIDLEAATLSVKRSVETIRGERHEKEPKTARSRRTVSLPAFVVTALRRHRMAQAQQLLQLGIGNRGSEGAVFTRIDGTAWEVGAFTLAFYRFMQRSGLPKIRFHDLRHSFGTLLRASGTDLKTISGALGHSTISTTANIYLHGVESLQKESADRLDRFVTSAMDKPKLA